MITYQFYAKANIKDYQDMLDSFKCHLYDAFGIECEVTRKSIILPANEQYDASAFCEVCVVLTNVERLQDSSNLYCTYCGNGASTQFIVQTKNYKVADGIREISLCDTCLRQLDFDRYFAPEDLCSQSQFDEIAEHLMKTFDNEYGVSLHTLINFVYSHTRAFVTSAIAKQYDLTPTYKYMFDLYKSGIIPEYPNWKAILIDAVQAIQNESEGFQQRVYNIIKGKELEGHHDDGIDLQSATLVLAYLYSFKEKQIFMRAKQTTQLQSLSNTPLKLIHAKVVPPPSAMTSYSQENVQYVFEKQDGTLVVWTSQSHNYMNAVNQLFIGTTDDVKLGAKNNRHVTFAKRLFLTQL